MASAERRTAERVRRDLESERRELAAAVRSLREELDVAPKLRARLPIAAAAAFAVGFVLAGGIGASMRLLFRRGRER